MTTPNKPVTLSDLAGDPPVSAAQVPQEASLTLDVSYAIHGVPAPYRGAIVLRAPSAHDEMRLARARARLCNGLPWDSYSPDAQALFSSMAVCEVMIVDAPPWFRQLALTRVHTDLYLAIYGEFVAFATDYFRGRNGEGDGAPGEPALSVRPRV
jgi:hypothetical protein